MLQVSGITKSYGSRILFEDVTFSMIRGERLGLVGRNGSGKSTIFRLILGEEGLDTGVINLPRGYRVGHLAQHLKFDQPNILSEACLGLPPEERDQEYRAEIILHGLGFTEADFSRAPHEFSGGFQIRLNLAKLLLSEPNLLLLDEPTNYLDIVSVRWLTNFLQNWKGELIIISHDRAFMDSVTTHTMLIHRSQVRKVSGGTEKLYSQIAVDEEVYEKTRLNENKKRRELEEFIARFRAQASKAALVQSKIKALERMGEKEELSEIESLDFEFREAPFPGKTVVELNKVSFGYNPDQPLIKELALSVSKGDRIGVIGKNGKGKSTLLKLIGGELAAQVGTISLNQNVQLGYFGQTNISRLSPKLTIEDEIESANPTLSKTAIRAICGSMMFSGDDALKKIDVLSGGEKSRVLLGRILALKTNLLLLDEPTNHLDMESIDALVESLRKYDGAVLIVTHSELILRALATKLIVFQGDKPEFIPHGYDYFLAKHGWGDEQIAISRREPTPEEKAIKAERATKRKIAALEQEIIALEAKQKIAEAMLAAEGDATKIGDIAMEIAGISEEITEKFELLEKLSAGADP